MWCCKCKNDLSQCTCPDLEERLGRLAQCQTLFIAPEAKEKYEAQAKRNKEEQSLEE